jgi:arrestin-2
VNLASSTLGSEGKTTAESLGIVISYSLRVKLNCGTLGGELQTDVPFKLMNPAPGEWATFTIQLTDTNRVNL